MSRRGGPGLQILIGVVVVGLFLYGFYSYHKVQGRLRTMEEKADRLKVQHESVSAQLQVVYEHKSRLEKTVQDERLLHKKTKDELNSEKQNLEQRMRQEKETLSQEVERLKSEEGKLEAEFNRAESEKQRLQEEVKNLQDSCDKQNELHQQQINQQRQECDNDVAQFKDEIADLSRRNRDLEAKVKNQSHELQVGSVDINHRNKSLQNDEGQHIMQIAEPGDNKPKAYFDVKSPAPVDKKLVYAQLRQQRQKEQVAPPVVKNGDTGDNNQPDDGADANQIPNEDDNRIKDLAVVTKSQDGNLGGVKVVDKNVIDRIPEDNAIREAAKEEKNIVPGQVPPPAAKNEGQPVVGNEKLQEGEVPNQVAKPDGDIPPGLAAKPGQGYQPGQVNPPGQEVKPVQNEQHGARIPNEDEIEEDQQAPNEVQQQNPDAKNAENEKEEEAYDDNPENNAKDM